MRVHARVHSGQVCYKCACVHASCMRACDQVYRGACCMHAFMRAFCYFNSLSMVQWFNFACTTYGHS